MAKVTFGPTTQIYPTPALLAGAMVDGKPNFTTVAWTGIANSVPPTLHVSLQHHRHTLRGIRQNLTFSVNVPSVDLVKETDYCGITMGSKYDKAQVCRFTVFYGKLGSAPMIEQCPVNLECRVLHMLDLGSHTMVIGRIEETHVSEDCLTDGKPDAAKIRPFCFTTSPERVYRAVGHVIAKGFSVGAELRARQ